MKRVLTTICLVFFATSIVACAPAGKKTAIGAGAGTVLGAGLGAVIGSATGDAGRGTAIGAGAGAITGALIGNAMDETDQQIAAQQGELDRQQELIEENRRIIDELRRRGADVRPTERGVVINLPDVLFEFDRSDLTYDARRTITDIADVLKTTRGRRIAVEGHTDSVGSFSYNQRLSQRRANSVARELEHNGVPRRQMTTRGFGEGKPIATNNSDAGRARNRRVEVIVEN